jgi:hypothetical protein
LIQIADAKNWYRIQMIPSFSSSTHKSPSLSLSLCVFLSISLSLVPLLRLFSVSLCASVLGIHHSHFGTSPWGPVTHLGGELGRETRSWNQMLN